MKKLLKLKLNQLEKIELDKNEQLEIRGGCVTACDYWCITMYPNIPTIKELNEPDREVTYY